jgi:hypothetical protein
MDNRRIKTNDVIDFLFKAEINFLIIRKGKPIMWEDCTPKVFSSIEDAFSEFNPKTDHFITEYAYIMQSLDEFCNYTDYENERLRNCENKAKEE